jgi:type I restriction enzyme, S subunit
MANTPNIRFQGFTDDWEQRKLGDYLQVSSEKNRDNRFTKDDVLSVSGEYGIVNQIEFQGRSFAGASVSNYGVVETGWKSDHCIDRTILQKRFPYRSLCCTSE